MSKKIIGLIFALAAVAVIILTAIRHDDFTSLVRTADAPSAEAVRTGRDARRDSDARIATARDSSALGAWSADSVRGAAAGVSAAPSGRTTHDSVPDPQRPAPQDTGSGNE